MMNPNNVHGLIDLKAWQMLLKQLPDVQLFHTQSMPKIFDYIAKDKDLPRDAIMTLMCGDVSRFDEAFAFYQACAKHQLSVELYLPSRLKTKWLAYTRSKNCSMSLIHDQKIEDNPRRLLYVDLLSNLFSRDVPAMVQPWISQMNTEVTPVVTIDLPAGLDATNGSALLTEPLYVDLVIGRLALMQGLFTGVAKAYVQQLHLLDDDFELQPSYQSFLLDHQQIETMLPKKIAYAYKGMYDRVLIIAGEKDMFGASVLAARAALISGAGWVEVFYQQGLVPPFGSLPEIIWHEVLDAHHILASIRAKDILVFGPGLGEGTWGEAVWQALNHLDNKMVLDASALHFMAKSRQKRINCIITPHPGEAALLLETSNTYIQAHRFEAIKQLYQHFKAAVVLKGSGSLIYTQEQALYVCPHGNAAMATQGMGDVLTGLIAGLWARFAEGSSAMLVAVWLHAKAADMLLEKNPDMIAIRASQVLDEIENHMQDVLCK